MNKPWVLVALVVSVLALFGCGDPPTNVGSHCQTDKHCGGAEGTSFTLTCDNTLVVGTPGGSCTVEDCTPDDPATEAAEDETTCPAGSRCVRERITRTGEIKNLCRRTCSQQSDCGEVIVCREVCETVEEEEKCSIQCKNEMECTPFWDLPREEIGDDAPRACILKRHLYKESE